MSSSESIAVKLHDFVYDKIVNIDSTSFLKRCSPTDLINIINIYYIERADPVMNLCLPACYEIFLMSNSPKVCEYIVYHVPLENDHAVQEFVNQYENDERYAWKVDLALNWIYMYSHKEEKKSKIISNKENAERMIVEFDNNNKIVNSASGGLINTYFPDNSNSKKSKVYKSSIQKSDKVDSDIEEIECL